MESNFRSTVLQHPGDDNDRERRHPRDILNPASSVASSSGAPPQGPPRPSAFSLRSPTQSEFNPPTGLSPPPGTSVNHHHSPPRPALSSFMSPSVGSGQPLPPSGQHTSSSNHHYAASPSPIRGSPAYYSQSQDMHQTRDKASGRSFYDPTTDTTTSERRMAEAGTWHRASTPKVSPHNSFSAVVVLLLRPLFSEPKLAFFFSCSIIGTLHCFICCSGTPESPRLAGACNRLFPGRRRPGIGAAVSWLPKLIIALGPFGGLMSETQQRAFLAAHSSPILLNLATKNFPP